MIIYKITNTINDNAYIGQTVQPFKTRIRQHRHNRKSLIGKAIHKYGWENFTVEILESCTSREELNEREKYYIAFYNTVYPNGYNLTDGGGSFSPSKKARKNMSIGQKRRYAKQEEHEKSSEAANKEPLSDEHRAKISAGLKKYYSDPKNIEKLCEVRQKQYTPELRAQRARESTGRKHTEETKKKQSESAKRRAQTPEGRAHLLAMNAKSNEVQAEKRLNEQNQQTNSKEDQNG